MASQHPTQAQAGLEPFRPHYPEIERIVDSEDFTQINEHFGQAYEALEAVSKQNGMGKARDAKKAMKALEQVMDLLKYLLKLKYEYLESQGAGSKKKASQSGSS